MEGKIRFRYKQEDLLFYPEDFDIIYEDNKYTFTSKKNKKEYTFDEDEIEVELFIMQYNDRDIYENDIIKFIATKERTVIITADFSILCNDKDISKVITNGTIII